jgi:thiol-disulfide isomerase/thioredoxin
MKKQMWVLGVIAALVAVAVYQNFAAADRGSAAQAEEAPKPNFAAPSFELTGMDGRTYQVGGERENPVLVNFWASWCEPCHLEAPDLQRLYEKYGGKLDIYAVNVTTLDSVKGAEEFVHEYELTFPVMLDKDGTVTNKYRVDGYPTSFLIGRDGIVADVVFGIVNPAEISRKVDRLLR